MSSSESDHDYDFDDAYDDNIDFGYEGILPFMFQPMYSEEEVEQRILERVVSRESVAKEPEVEARQCECDNCVDMKVENETLCCIHSLSEGHTTLFNGAKCIAETRGFSLVCLEKDVLETSLGAWERLVGDRRNVCNKSYRFIAYKQYIWWIYGRLGKDVRKRIPTCVLYKIRTTYPDPNNIYVPFSMS